MSRAFTIGGVIASIILIVAGIGTIVVAATGQSDVKDRIEQEKIVGTPDMNPDDTRAAVEEAGLTDVVDIPDCSVADKEIDSGDRAQCFADYMRVHALEDTGGKTYAEMPRFATKDGAGTNDPAEAQKGPGGEPMSNPARQIWVTETALSTALNTSFFAEQVAMFSLLVGIALLLTGLGFVVLTFGLHRRHGRDDTAAPGA
jgi:hypothetical protein